MDTAIVKPVPSQRILVIPDKFKGSLSAPDVAKAIAAGWQTIRPDDVMECLPMSDGGDGFGEVLASLTTASVRTTKARDAAHRPITAEWWWQRNQKLAVVESARIIGLARLSSGRFHPFQLDTFGLGTVLRTVARAGVKHCLVGLGGSATNDGGFGLARALGWKFFGAHGEILEHWWQLIRLVRITPPLRPLKLRITLALDVANPLLGRNGCSRVYGPQKGLQADEIAFAEQCLHRLNKIVMQQWHLHRATMPGAGAAGGLGFGLMTFAQARPRSGFEVFAEAADLSCRIQRADLVITGEGAMDRQSFMGKGVGQIAKLCRELKVPCAAIVGAVKTPGVRKQFWQTKSLVEITDLASAQRAPRRYLLQAAAKVAQAWCS